jgi:hypothetical protein
MELSREIVDRIGELFDMGLDDDAICAVIVKEYATRVRRTLTIQSSSRSFIFSV